MADVAAFYMHHNGPAQERYGKNETKFAAHLHHGTRESGQRPSYNFHHFADMYVRERLTRHTGRNYATQTLDLSSFNTRNPISKVH
jgi:hypothetical protein